jgi:hypothetical protein
VLLTSRFIIVFDGSSVTLVPDSVFYLLLFSQPLMTLSFIYWTFLETFLILMICEGIPVQTLLGLRIVRSVTFGVTLGFTVLSATVFGLRGMLTLPLFLTLVVTLLSSFMSMLEVFLGRLEEPDEYGHSAGYLRRSSSSSTRNPIFAGPNQRESVLVGPRASVSNQRMSRHYIPVPVQMQGGKKAV